MFILLSDYYFFINPIKIIYNNKKSMFKFNDTTIQGKILLGFSTIIGAIFIFAIVLLVNNETLKEEIDTFDASNNNLIILQDMDIELQSMFGSHSEFVEGYYANLEIVPDGEDNYIIVNNINEEAFVSGNNNFNQAEAVFDEKWKILYGSRVTTEEEKFILDSIMTKKEFMTTAKDELVAAYRLKDAKLAEEKMGFFDEYYNKTSEDVDSLAALIKKDVLHKKENMNQIFQQNNYVMAFAVAVSLILSIFTYFIISKSIKKSLRSYIDQIISASNTLAATTQQTSSTAQQNASISQQVASGAVEQSKQAEEISKSISEMAGAIQQMSAATKDAASRASVTSDIAQDSGQKSEKSRESIEKIKNIVGSTEGMAKGMADKSKEIGDIVETITTIADQTNLLALNAAIEAARAGEAGRGFAVVADEVRKLAEESSEAAEKIKLLVKNMVVSIEDTVKAAGEGTREVDEGVAVVGDTINGLQKITSSIMQVSANIEQISAGVEQQAKTTQVMAEKMDSIVAISEQNSSGAQQLSAATQQQSSANQQIAGAAEKLQALASSLFTLIKRSENKKNNKA